MDNTLDKQLEQEKKMQVEATTTYDYKEGVNSFLEKRKPVFKGNKNFNYFFMFDKNSVIGVIGSGAMEAALLRLRQLQDIQLLFMIPTRKHLIRVRLL